MRSLFACVGMAGAIFVSGCGTSSAGGVEQSSVLVISSSADADNLLPPLTITSAGHQVTDQIFDYLADIGPKIETVADHGFTPRLADSWTWGPDSTSVVFHLNPRARWHDGVPVRAQDVRFTYQLLANPKTGSSITSELGNVDSVSVRDSLTAVVWYHRQMQSNFYNFVYNVAILPKHLLDSVPPDKLASSAFARHPVGSGRFRLGTWEAGSRIVLVSDSGNYRGPAKIDRVIWTIAPDMHAATMRLLTGEADFMEAVRGPTLTQVMANPKIRLLETPALDYGYLEWNLSRKAFSDKAVRMALSQAVDRHALVQNVFNGHALVGLGPMTRALPFADTTIGGVPFDSAAAHKVLSAKGFKGFTILVPTSSAVRMQYATLLQAEYAAVGVKVKIEAVDPNVFAKRVTSGDFDGALMAWKTDPSAQSVSVAWGSKAFPPQGANFARYGNASFDAYVDSTSKADNITKARAYFHQATRIITEDAPAVWLYESQDAKGASQRVHTHDVRADSWWADLPDWTVSPKGGQ